MHDDHYGPAKHKEQNVYCDAILDQVTEEVEHPFEDTHNLRDLRTGRRAIQNVEHEATDLPLVPASKPSDGVHANASQRQPTPAIGRRRGNPTGPPLVILRPEFLLPAGCMAAGHMRAGRERKHSSPAKRHGVM